MPYRPPVFTDPTTGLTETFYERYDKEWQAALEAERTAAEEQRMRTSNLMDYARTFMGVKAEERAARQEETENFLKALALANEKRRMELMEADAQRDMERDRMDAELQARKMDVLEIEEQNERDRIKREQQKATQAMLKRYDDDFNRDMKWFRDQQALLRQYELELRDEPLNATLTEDQLDEFKRGVDKAYDQMILSKNRMDQGHLEVNPDYKPYETPPYNREYDWWTKQKGLSSHMEDLGRKWDREMPGIPSETKLAIILNRGENVQKLLSAYAAGDPGAAAILEDLVIARGLVPKDYERTTVSGPKGLFDEPGKEKVKAGVKRAATEKAHFETTAMPFSGAVRGARQIAGWVKEPGETLEKVKGMAKPAVAAMEKAWKATGSPDELSGFWGLEVPGFSEAEAEEEME